MPYPSQAMLLLWCRNVEELRREMFKLGKAREDGWCQCQIGEAIGRFCPQDQQAQFCSGLFWSIWIDQVLYSVSEKDFYWPSFYDAYPFPKLHCHATGGHASPAFLLGEPPPGTPPEDWPYQRPSRELLLEDKKSFWGEIAAWLRHLGRQDVLQAAEDAFKEDLQRRFPEDLQALLSE